MKSSKVLLFIYSKPTNCSYFATFSLSENFKLILLLNSLLLKLPKSIFGCSLTSKLSKEKLLLKKS